MAETRNKGGRLPMCKPWFKKVLLFLGIFILAANPAVAWSGNDEEARIIGMKFPKSYDINTFQDKTDGILNVTYKVHLSYPSKEIVEFYNGKFKKIGWVPFVEDYYRYGDRVWQDFLDGTVEGMPLVHQLIADWVNKDKTRRVVLGIRYYSVYSSNKEKMNAKKPNNDVQEVALQFMPFHILPPPGPGKGNIPGK